MAENRLTFGEVFVVVLTLFVSLWVLWRFLLIGSLPDSINRVIATFYVSERYARGEEPTQSQPQQSPALPPTVPQQMPQAQDPLPESVPATPPAPSQLAQPVPPVVTPAPPPVPPVQQVQPPSKESKYDCERRHIASGIDPTGKCK